MRPAFVLFLFIGLIGTWAAVIYLTYKAWAPYIRSRKQPIRRAHVSVSGKRTEDGHIPTHHEERIGQKHDPSEQPAMEPVRWFLSFRYDTGDDIELPVSMRTWESICVDDRGELAWRGELFVEFILEGYTPPVKEPRRSDIEGWM